MKIFYSTFFQPLLKYYILCIEEHCYSQSWYLRFLYPLIENGAFKSLLSLFNGL
jgi:hypothetical protein